MNIASKLILCVSFVGATLHAQRINQEGRILGAVPTLSSPVLFNTPEADAIVSAMQILPLDNPFNEDISRRPRLSNSDAMIAQIRSDLATNRRTLRLFHEMNYVLVPDSQPLVPIAFVDYPDDSDPSPYPIPGNMPIETWPRETGSLTLEQWQRDVNGDGGDRHSIVVAPGAGFIWETWQAKLVGSNWQASNGAKFNLRTNALRPAGWTSGDAAGLPMFPAIVRYDECQRGMVEHAMRIVVAKSRREYIYPATHYASTIPASSVNVPAMGQRVRLKADFVIPDTWTIYAKAVARGLKKYGAFVADNGGFFSISVTPDDRYPAGAFDQLSTIDVNQFEVIQTTGPAEGPRSPGAPAANAGADFTGSSAGPNPLNGSATGSGISVEWTKYSGPGTVTFGNPAQASTTVSFGAIGTYTLMLNVSDGVHAVARDAVVVTVIGDANPGYTLSASPSSRTLIAGEATTYTVSAVPQGPASAAVELSASGLPAGATASFNPTSVTPGATSTLTVSTAAASAASVSSLTIAGNSSIGARITNVTLTVNRPSPTPVADPVFSPAGGSYAAAQTVSITTATAGASVRYTLDGSTPTPTFGTAYTGPISISSSATLRALAYKEGSTPSNVMSAVYTITPPASTLSWEAEALTFVASGAPTSFHSDGRTSGGRWLALEANSVGDWIEFTTPHLPAGTYRIHLSYKSNWNRGRLAFRLDGSVIGSQDQYASAAGYPTRIFAPVTFATAGAHKIRLTVTGRNSGSGGYLLSADKIAFVKQ